MTPLRVLLLGFSLGLSAALVSGCPATATRVEPTCGDGVRNGGEADVDCGGPCTVPCGEGLRCGAGPDCASGVCQKGLCRPPTCADGQRNGAETDVDCGGACPACETGLGCADAGDCRTRVCAGGSCRELTCGNGTLDGTETDLDCGGRCASCAAGRSCAVPSDCASGTCRDGGCGEAGCADGVRNGAETGVDCGGTCPACADGQPCDGGQDCQSARCLDAVCRPASCADQVQDGDEADVDCGGRCAPCPPGRHCRQTTDCAVPAHAQVGCDAGLCRVVACATDWADCDQSPANGCEASLTSTGHCLGCGTACELPNANSTCEQSGCEFASCARGFGNCDLLPSTGCERALDSLTDCGACGAACEVAHGAATCAGGTCRVASCEGVFADCDLDAGNGCEVDRASNPAHCGGCGQACALGPNVVEATCVGAACGVKTCGAGWGNCDGQPANGCEQALDSNVLHCGACGQTCPVPAHATPGCSGAGCGVGACLSGWGNCNGAAADGCEVDVLGTAAHCGKCGQACSTANATSACDAGACALTACSAGFADCNGAAGDGCEASLGSVTTCGACTNACASGMVCVSGNCQPTACSQLPTTTASGVQTLYAGTTPYAAYCDFPGGGALGWTLAMKVDGTKSTFAYAAALWTDLNTLNPASTDLTQTEARLSPTFNVPFTQLRLGMVEGGNAIRWMTLDTGLKANLRAAVTATSSTSAGRAAWMGLLGSPSLQSNCNREGLNVTAAGYSVRLGIIGNNENNCDTPDSFIGFGSNQAAVSTGNLAGFNGSGMDRTTKTFGYIFVR